MLCGVHGINRRINYKHMKIITRFFLLLSVVGAVACKPQPQPVEWGVGEDLAVQRRANISQIRYSLSFDIPAQKHQPISAMEQITFSVAKAVDVVMDFQAPSSSVQTLVVNGHACDVPVDSGHIVIPASFIRMGANVVDIKFTTESQSLNRKDEFLYTLLVPDRASTVFPCFDQPDLKAVFSLSLTMPSGWLAQANAPVESVHLNDSTKTIGFSDTQPISTYLFAFAAGRFREDSCTHDGRTIKMLYRETDNDKVARNRDAIFNAHFQSLKWMEDYTTIQYPFSKFDIVLIPDFQYGGMEHVGCIFYNESTLMLDKNPSESKLLRRASLIAHETSHQWFGNLVTMRWFNDVWLKEVFAGLMADKVVNPQFPKINHRLNFLLSHYPRAYSVDRTEGANPIRQRLDNLQQAGTLYGDIIYHKAPIAFDQLEMLLGEDTFRLGLQKYLINSYMDNADWSDLIMILDSLTPIDLQQWSLQWIKGKGMPEITMLPPSDGVLKLVQNNKNTTLPMIYSVRIDDHEYTVNHDSKIAIVEDGRIGSVKSMVLNYNGKGYGFFVPDESCIAASIDCAKNEEEPVARAANFINVFELFLRGYVARDVCYSYFLESVVLEPESQIRSYILGNIETIYWNFMTTSERLANAGRLEATLLQLIKSNKLPVSERKPIFTIYSGIALTDSGVALLYDVWNKRAGALGIELFEQDYIDISYQLAVRSVPQSDSILDVQAGRITNPDRLAKFNYVRRAVTPNEQVRVDFFNCLSDVKNRRPEPWTIEALRFFNHPLRADFAVNYLKDALDLLPEVQRTGDIFFPKSWLGAILGGHNSSTAQQVTRTWLKMNTNLPDNLRYKVLQSTDMLNRSRMILEKNSQMWL